MICVPSDKTLTGYDQSHNEADYLEKSDRTESFQLRKRIIYQNQIIDITVNRDDSVPCFRSKPTAAYFVVSKPIGEQPGWIKSHFRKQLRAPTIQW